MPVRFGLTTQIHPKQTVPSLKTNIALLEARPAVEKALQETPDAIDPITLTINIEESGTAQAELATQNTRQKKTIALADAGQAAPFWQTVLEQVHALVPTLKSLPQLHAERLTGATDLVDQFTQALDSKQLVTTNPNKVKGFGGDFGGYQSVEAQLNNEQFVVTLGSRGNVTLHNSAKGYTVNFYPDRSVRIQKNREEAGQGYEIPEDAATPDQADTPQEKLVVGLNLKLKALCEKLIAAKVFG